MAKSLDEWIKKIEKREISLEDLDDLLGNANLAALVRRLYLEKSFKISLTGIASSVIDFEALKSLTRGTAIGAVQIPLYILGPVSIEGGAVSGEAVFPLALIDIDGLALLNDFIGLTKGGLKVFSEVKDVEIRSILIAKEGLHKWQTEESLKEKLPADGSFEKEFLKILEEKNVLVLKVRTSLLRLSAVLSEAEEVLTELCSKGYELMRHSYVFETRSAIELPLDALIERKDIDITELKNYIERSLAIASRHMDVTSKLVTGFFTAIGLSSAKLSTGSRSATISSQGLLSIAIEGSIVNIDERELKTSLRLPTQSETLSLIGITDATEKAMLRLAELASALVAFGEIASLLLFIYGAKKR
ncbi:MAG: hypothetical protein QW065_00910 [Acidilobaceae archaeon]